jgi:hypothetical protein
MTEKESLNRQMESALSDFYYAFHAVVEEVRDADGDTDKIDSFLEVVEDDGWDEKSLNRAAEMLDITDSLQGQLQILLGNLDSARNNLDKAIGEYQGELDNE